MAVVVDDIAVADSGNTRVLGAPWQRWKRAGGSEVLFRYMDAATVERCLKGACTLRDDEQKTLLAVHEVGHMFAMHAMGLEYGGIVINPESPGPRDGRTDLQQFARAEWRELPRTAREAAMAALGGWVATETWLELVTVNGRKLREDKMNVCRAHLAAADDHYDLMCFPTPRPTAYLYGRVQPPDDWQGEVIVVERLVEELTEMLVFRWPRVIQLATAVLTMKGAEVKVITEALGDPGWAK